MRNEAGRNVQVQLNARRRHAGVVRRDKSAYGRLAGRGQDYNNMALKHKHRLLTAACAFNLQCSEKGGPLLSASHLGGSAILEEQEGKLT